MEAGCSRVGAPSQGGVPCDTERSWLQEQRSSSSSRSRVSPSPPLLKHLHQPQLSSRRSRMRPRYALLLTAGLLLSSAIPVAAQTTSAAASLSVVLQEWSVTPSAQ